MEDNCAQTIIDAIQALKTALQQAPAADRSMAVILAMDDLTMIFSRIAADRSYFLKAFTDERPPQPLPRVLAG
jgi:hypothetical protein